MMLTAAVGKRAGNVVDMLSVDVHHPHLRGNFSHDDTPSANPLLSESMLSAYGV